MSTDNEPDHNSYELGVKIAQAEKVRVCLEHGVDDLRGLLEAVHTLANTMIELNSAIRRQYEDGTRALMAAAAILKRLKDGEPGDSEGDNWKHGRSSN